MKSLPPYLTPAQIAAAVAARTGEECDSRDIRNQCRRAGILEKDGERWHHIGQSRLRERLSDLYEAVFEHYVIDGNPMPPR